jgi:predicted nucleotidyltransferase
MAAIERARDIAKDLGMRPLAAHCDLAHARICRAVGNRADAELDVTNALSCYRDLGMVRWQQRAETLLLGDADRS